MSIKIKKITFILFVLFFCADHCLWLVNSNAQNIITETFSIIIPCMLIFCFRKNLLQEPLNKERYHFGYNILFFVIMVFYSSIQAYFMYGQSIIHTFLLQRHIIVGFLLYFVIMWYINHKSYALESLTKMIFFLGLLELTLYIAQYLLIDQVRFLQANYTIRMNEVRMNLDAIAVPFLIFYSMNNIYKNKQITWKEIAPLVTGLFYSFFIAKTRIVLVAYTVAFIAGYLVWKKGGKKKIGVLFILIAFVCYLAQTELFSLLIDGLNNVDPSAQTRTIGRELYIQRIIQHPLLGSGYIFSGNAKASAYAGIDQGIYWVDLGFFGIAFFYGMVGVLWFTILYSKILIRSFKMAKKGNYIFWMYSIYLIILSFNGTGYMWYISNTFGLVLWLCLIEGNYNRINSECHNTLYVKKVGDRHGRKKQTIRAIENS